MKGVPVIWTVDCGSQVTALDENHPAANKLEWEHSFVQLRAAKQNVLPRGGKLGN